MRGMIAYDVVFEMRLPEEERQRRQGARTRERMARERQER
jgi:hypothetical protein